MLWKICFFGGRIKALLAVILAGGLGTRLRSVTGDLPKPMAPIAGKPVLAHILELLRRCGVREACVTLRYRPECIRDYFGTGERFGVRLTYHEEPFPLGTAGAVRACRDFYGERDFLVIPGDCACDADLGALMEAHRRHRPAATIAVHACPEPLEYGTVLADRSGRIVSFIEKPAWRRVVSDMVNTGIYVLSPAAMELVPEGREFDFARDLFPTLLRAGETLRALPLGGYWRDIGSPRSYYQCCLDALGGVWRLPGAADSPPPPAPEPADAPHYAVRERCACLSRARMMRALSETLMEAGADFSDGLTLRSSRGSVHIAPESGREALDIEADTPELAAEFSGLVRALEDKS